MNLVLVGFMGTGKNVVGSSIAKKLNMKYIDIDQLIETQEERIISDIFAREGESYFRKIEKEITKRVSKDDNAVIAAGGGVVLDDENIKNLKSKGIIFCLEATPEVIIERTKGHAHRPLLKVKNPQKEILNLLNQRAPHYAKADFCIDTSNLNVEEVVNKIIAVYRSAKNERA